jgi:hypothetical protein
MVVTMQQVLDALNPFEPDYSEAEIFGSEALPHLEILVKTAEPLLASKAASMASMIQDTRSVNILMTCTKSKFREVRVAAAVGSGNLRVPGVDKILGVLTNDQDEGVRRIAVKSIESRREAG